MHALLSASGAKRWMECPPSAHFEKGMSDTASSYAEEGTLAHAIAETRLSHALGRISTRKLNAKMKEHKAHELYSPSMDEHLDTYIEYVLALVQQARKRCADPEIMLEMRLDFSRWVPEGFGTGDVVIVADGVCDVVDLKFGKGVAVDAKENPQLRLYGLGAFNELDMLYDLQEISMHIVQPRLNSVTKETLSSGELLQWANEEVIPKAKLAFDGMGEFKSGEHCRFCRGKTICRKYAFDKLELAKYEFREGPELTDDEIANVLRQSEELASWAKSIKDYAAGLAIHAGKQWPGWKLVAGRSTRKITKEEDAIAALDLEGFPMEKTCTLLGLGKLEALVGKKRLPEILGDLIEKTDPAPTLVPEEDKRPIWNSAKTDFEEAI